MDTMKRMGILTAILLAFSISQTAIAQTSSNQNGPNLFLDKIIKVQDSTMAQNSLRLLSYSKKYSITSKSDLKTTVKKLFSDKYFHFPVANNDLSKINILTKEEIIERAKRKGKDDHKVLSTTKKNLMKYLNQKMSVGNNIYTYRLNWKIHNKKFSTLAIFDSKGIIYDHIFVNLIRFETKTSH